MVNEVFKEKKIKLKMVNLLIFDIFIMVTKSIVVNVTRNFGEIFLTSYFVFVNLPTNLQKQILIVFEIL